MSARRRNVRGGRSAGLCTAALFLALFQPAGGYADALTPGPVDLPSAPSRVEDLADFERRLGAVQGAFFAYEASGPRQPIADSVLYLDTEPVTAPLPGGAAPISCGDFHRVAGVAAKRWERVIARVEAIRREVHSIREGTSPGGKAKGFERIGAQIDAAGDDVEAAQRAYPREVYGTPDRLIRYVWKVAPRSLIDEWGEGWTLVGDSFSPGFLSMPGYLWAGQGSLGEIATLAGEPSSTGRTIVLERLATPAQACAGDDAVWMSGRAMIRFKRTATKPQGCSGEPCLGQGGGEMLEVRDGMEVVLRGQTRPDGIIGTTRGTGAPPCPKPDDVVEKPPTQCPD